MGPPTVDYSMPDPMPTLLVNAPFHLVRQNMERLQSFQIGVEVFINNQAVYEIESSQARELGRELDDRGLTRTVHAPFMDLSPGAIDKDVRAISRDKLKRAVEIANLIGAKGIVCHGGYDKWRFGSNKQAWLYNSVETWTEVLKGAGDLTVMIENIFEETPETITALLDHFKDKLWSCFDTGHFNLFSSVPLDTWLHALKGRLKEFHIHDNHGKTDEHLPIGQGDFPFRELKVFLKSLHGVFFTAEAASEAAAVETIRYAKEFLS